MYDFEKKNIGIVLGILLVCILGFGLFYAFVTFVSVEEALKDYGKVILAGIMTGTAITGFICLVGNEFTGANSALIKEGRVIEECYFTNPTFLFTWNLWYGKYKGAKLVNYSTPVVVHLGASPITENPKVLNLIYDIPLDVQLGIKGYQAFYDSFQGDMEKAIKYVRKCLFKFNAVHSKDLIKLTNPEDSEEQRTFRNIVDKFLWPLTKNKGLRINAEKTNFDFWIPQIQK